MTTPYFYGAYAVPLPSPYAVAAGGSSSVTGAGGGTVTLLPGGGPSGTALAYSLDVPSSLAPAPPPDGRLSVTVTVSFRQSIGYSVLNLPTNRCRAVHVLGLFGNVYVPYCRTRVALPVN